MTPREQLKRSVIMALHKGKSYEEALKEELRFGCQYVSIEQDNDGDFYPAPAVISFNIPDKSFIDQIIGLPITIGRVMAALDEIKCRCNMTESGYLSKINDYWKLTDSTGNELTDDSQSDECIEALIKLF